MKFNNNIKEVHDALRSGKRVTRPHFHILKAFIFKQNSNVIDKDIVPNMTSLPNNVKEEFKRRFENIEYQLDKIYYDNQLVIVNSSNLITTYTFSNEDFFAEDWIILD